MNDGKNDSVGLIGRARLGVEALKAFSAVEWTLTLLAISLCLLMLPFGRSSPDSGGLLAPLTVDSGYLSRQIPGLDFYSIYAAGDRLMGGADPYATDPESPEGKTSENIPYFTDFRYPPSALVLLSVPLNVLPPVFAYSLWVAFLLGLLFWNYLLALGESRGKHSLLLALISFCWFPMIAEFHLGQFSLFTGSLIYWGVLLWLDRRRNWFFPWTYAILVKLIPLTLVPALFRKGARLPVVVTMIVLVVVYSGYHLMAGDQNYGDETVERDLKKGLLIRKSPPYAGAQGIQAGVNALVWKVSGHSFAQFEYKNETPVYLDPSAIISVLFSLSYLLLYLYLFVRKDSYLEESLLVVGWVGWFFLYKDCWEHHYTLLLPCVLMMVSRSLVTPRAAVILWGTLGGASLWWIWQRTGYHSSMSAEVLGFLYFLQRPVGIFFLLGMALTMKKLGKSPGVHEKGNRQERSE